MIKIICDSLGVIICQIISLNCYKNISSYDPKLLNLKNLLILIATSILGYFNNAINYSAAKAVIHFLILVLLFFLVFNENLKRTVIKSIIIYLILCSFELIFSFIIIFTKVYADSIQENVIIKLAYSVVIMLFTLLFFEFGKIKALIKRTVDSLSNKKNLVVNILSYVLFAAVLVVAFEFSKSLTLDSYLSNIFILTIVTLFFVFFIIQYIKVKKAEEKEEILLNFMSKYEKILDKDRINRHEILNNLLILKSFENRNTKKYEEVLNSIIKEYENKDKNIFVNLYNLPTGLKGLLYYKVYEMKNSNIDVTLSISNKVLPKLEKMESKDFTKLCRMLGIILDNAKEAAENSNVKNVILDIYEENKKIVIYVENTTKNKVDINMIYEKNYSTKGKNRGLGLYLAKEIVRNSTIFGLEQYSNEPGKFVSIITIL